MVRDQVHKLVDDLFDLRRALVGDHVPPEAQAHFWAARKEALLGVRAVADHALNRLEAQEVESAKESGAHSIPVET